MRGSISRKECNVSKKKVDVGGAEASAMQWPAPRQRTGRHVAA
jgi:hypothetical protein